MKKLRFLPQEILKLIACVSMLIDHVGAVCFPELTALRIIGRLAFPIYCFLLCQGMKHTRSPLKYLLRLFLCIFLAELPFDYAIYGGLNWQHQNVMLTLFLGGCMVLCFRYMPNKLLQAALVIPFAMLADLLRCDYGATGILMIAVFALLQGASQWIGLLLCCFVCDAGYYIMVLEALPQVGISYLLQWMLKNPPMELAAIFAMIPISLYSGRKLTRSKTLQMGFYLYYPLHLAVLALLANFIL